MRWRAGRRKCRHRYARKKTKNSGELKSIARDARSARPPRLSRLDDDFAAENVAMVLDGESHTLEPLEQTPPRVVRDVLVGVSRRLRDAVGPFDQRPLPAAVVDGAE